MVITTYCSSSGGDTYSGCDPDAIEDINNQIEDAITDLIDDDPDLTLDEIVAELVDDLRRWYPNWSSGSKSECKNDGKYPSYSKYLCKHFHLLPVVLIRISYTYNSFNSRPLPYLFQ